MTVELCITLSKALSNSIAELANGCNYCGTACEAWHRHLIYLPVAISEVWAIMIYLLRRPSTHHAPYDQFSHIFTTVLKNPLKPPPPIPKTHPIENQEDKKRKRITLPSSSQQQPTISPWDSTFSQRSLHSDSQHHFQHHQSSKHSSTPVSP
jgi:hypothetical protein